MNTTHIEFPPQVLHPLPVTQRREVHVSKQLVEGAHTAREHVDAGVEGGGGEEGGGQEGEGGHLGKNN